MTSSPSQPTPSQPTPTPPDDPACGEVDARPPIAESAVGQRPSAGGLPAEATEISIIQRQGAQGAAEPQATVPSGGWLRGLPPRGIGPADGPAAVRSAIFVHAGLLLVSLLVIGLSLIMRVQGEDDVFLPGWSQPIPGSCASRTLFGIECPGCGLTRCFISMSDGDWGRAWDFNPGGMLFYAIVLAQIPWRTFQLLRLFSGRGEKWVGKFDWIMWLLAILMLAQWFLPPQVLVEWVR